MRTGLTCLASVRWARLIFISRDNKKPLLGHEIMCDEVGRLEKKEA